MRSKTLHLTICLFTDFHFETHVTKA